MTISFCLVHKWGIWYIFQPYGGVFGIILLVPQWGICSHPKETNDKCLLKGSGEGEGMDTPGNDQAVTYGHCCNCTLDKGTYSKSL